MLFIAEIAERIEDHLSERGLPSRAYCLSPDGDLDFGIVFPMGREYDLQAGLAAAQAELVPVLGGAIDFTPRTVLRYFSSELFGGVPRPQGTLISTNVTNLHTPHSAICSAASHEGAATRGGLPVRTWAATVLTYDIDLVVICPQEEQAFSLAEPLRLAAQVFNLDTRFLKIGRLRHAWSPTRLVVGQPVLRYEELLSGA